MRLIQYNPNRIYQLNDLIFYIPKSNVITPFLIVKDLNGKTDILKLSQIKTDGIYNVFTVASQQILSVAEGTLICSILILTETHSRMSANTTIQISFDNYEIGNKVTLLKDVANEVYDTYKKIEELTKLNITIYEAIEEGIYK